jgi:hypothetical protein
MNIQIKHCAEIAVLRVNLKVPNALSNNKRGEWNNRRKNKIQNTGKNHSFTCILHIILLILHSKK